MQKTTIPAPIKAAITRFDVAAQDYAFKGAAHPDDHHAIDARYKKARENLERLIANYLD